MMNTSKSTDMRQDIPFVLSGPQPAVARLERRESEQAVTVVRNQRSGGGAQDDRSLRQGNQCSRSEGRKHGITRALRDSRHCGIAHRLLTLAAAAAIERERPVEPPSHNARCKERKKAGQERMNTFDHDNCEKD